MTWMSGIPLRLHGVAAVLLFPAVLSGDSRCTSLIDRKVTDDGSLIKSCVGVCFRLRFQPVNTTRPVMNNQIADATGITFFLTGTEPELSPDPAAA
jgi:hypothetical protein